MCLKVAAPSAPATPVAAPTAAPASAAAARKGRVFASPLAKKLAAEKGIDLSQVTGECVQFQYNVRTKFETEMVTLVLQMSFPDRSSNRLQDSRLSNVCRLWTRRKSNQERH